MAITREDYVTQSVQDYVRKALFDDRDYPEAVIEFLESFDEDMLGDNDDADKNYIASGFDFDDSGKSLEMGSTFITRTYTLEFFVIGMSAVWGKNLAQAIKFGLEYDGMIPLVDITEPERPQIDALIFDGASANKVIVADPAPWQKHIWVTRARVIDEYDARLT